MRDGQRIPDSLSLPDALEGSGLLVGWSLEIEHKRNPIGFSFGDPQCTPATGYIDPILMEAEGHLMTIAPTGAGKGTGCIVPALLRFQGPVIVIDPKGENALITARRRRELGHEVAVLDPMGITGLESAMLNPLDLLDPKSPTVVDDAMAIVANLSDDGRGSDTTNGEYWSERGATFVLGVLLHVISDLPENRRHLGEVRRLVARAMGELGIYEQVANNRNYPKEDIAPTVLGALERSNHREARRIGQMLRMGALSTLGGILSFSQSIVEVARGPAITASLARTSFDLDSVTRGDPLSIYLVMPPHMLDSHGRLLRLWVHTLMTLITRRNARPEKSTLFLLDEVAQLGTFAPLRRAITLMRGYGLQTWSFWQDPSQLRVLYPDDWQTMVNNCRSVQCFGANTMLAAESMARIVGFRPPEKLLDLQEDEMLLQLSGDLPVIARLPDYRTNPAFDGMADLNPFHDTNRPIMRAPLKFSQKTDDAGDQDASDPDGCDDDDVPALPDEPLTPKELLEALQGGDTGSEGRP